jgi:hypothetical protein
MCVVCGEACWLPWARRRCHAYANVTAAVATGVGAHLRDLGRPGARKLGCSAPGRARRTRRLDLTQLFERLVVEFPLRIGYGGRAATRVSWSRRLTMKASTASSANTALHLVYPQVEK